MREALAKRSMLKELDQLSGNGPSGCQAISIIGESPAIQHVRDQIPKWRNCPSRYSAAVKPGRQGTGGPGHHN